MSDQGIEVWDRYAATYDEEPDHGLRDSSVRRAWADLLLPLMPPPPSSIVDIGCGTGSLSVLLAEAGHSVVGVDSSPRMIAAAREKTGGGSVLAEFIVGDAEAPPLAAGAFDAVLARHVLWALRDPAAALQRWVELLSPRGVLVLIEGRWATGAGLPATETLRLVRTVRAGVSLRRLDDEKLWGKPVSDERYLVVAES